MKKGFTLLEILLVIAAIGILAAIVIVAINPNRQLAQARNAERRSETNSLLKGVEQYLIDNGRYPGNVSSFTSNTTIEVCAEGVSEVDCTNDSLLYLGEITPTYLSSIPADPSATGNGTGYSLQYNSDTNRISISSTLAELDEVIVVGPELNETFVLDQIDSTIVRAYGLRKLISSYDGPLIRVRREGDSAELDIGMNDENELDVDALQSFIGSVDAEVIVWYDQSSNDEDATPNTTGPNIINNGTLELENGKPTLAFEGGERLLYADLQTEILNSFYFSVLASTNSTHEVDPENNTTTDGVLNQRYVLGAPYYAPDAGQGLSFGTNGFSNYEHADGYMPATAVYSGSITGLALLGVNYENRLPTLFLNGQEVRTGVTSARAVVHPSTEIGDGGYGNFYGNVSEVILLDESFPSDQRTILDQDQLDYFQITP